MGDLAERGKKLNGRVILLPGFVLWPARFLSMQLNIRQQGTWILNNPQETVDAC